MNPVEFKFPCPHCKQNLQCEIQFAGLQTQCPNCKQLINIPSPPTAAGFGHLSQRARTRNALGTKPEKAS